MSCSLLELHQAVQGHQSTWVFNTLPPLPTSIIPSIVQAPYHFSPLHSVCVLSHGGKEHLLNRTNEINWKVLFIIVFHLNLKRMTTANGLCKTNEPVPITTQGCKTLVNALTSTHWCDIKWADETTAFIASCTPVSLIKHTYKKKCRDTFPSRFYHKPVITFDIYVLTSASPASYKPSYASQLTAWHYLAALRTGFTSLYKSFFTFLSKYPTIRGSESREWCDGRERTCRVGFHIDSKSQIIANQILFTAQLLDQLLHAHLPWVRALRIISF